MSYVILGLTIVTMFIILVGTYPAQAKISKSDKNEYYYEDQKMESPTYYLWRIWYRSTDYLGDIIRGRRIRWFIQRRRRGFDDRELWSLNDTITRFVYPRLKAFAEQNKMGYPTAIFEDEDAGYGFGDKISDEREEYYTKKWDDLLNSMVLAFKYMDNDGEDIESGLGERMMDTWPSRIPDRDEEKWNAYTTEMERREEVIRVGLENFSCYFQNLWD